MMYKITHQVDGMHFHCEGRTQDSTERWTKDSLYDAVQSMIRFAKSANGETLTAEDFDYFREVSKPPSPEVVRWEPFPKKGLPAKSTLKIGQTVWGFWYVQEEVNNTTRLIAKYRVISFDDETVCLIENNPSLRQTVTIKPRSEIYLSHADAAAFRTEMES